MREINERGRKKYKRKKKKGGCLGYLGKLLFFLIVFGGLIGLGFRLFTDLSLKTQFLQARYPIKYQAFVEEYAQANRIEPSLLYAIIRTESHFDPYASSNMDARGLMQVQPETARDCAKELKLSNFTADDLYDPETNIRLGSYYFKKLLRLYNGNIKNAIAAYNAGPGNVDKWLADPNNVQNGTLVKIPFSETKHYVEKILSAMEYYQILYENPES